MSKASAAPTASPAVYLHGGPGSGCQPDHRRLFDPERFHAILFDQRGAGRSRPKGGREHNTLPHLIADMETIRENIRHRALDDRRRLLGRDAGAGLCASAPASRQRHRAARDISRHACKNWKAHSSMPCRASIPNSASDFLGLLPPDERAQPLDAYWRAHSRSRSRRAWPGRARLA